MVLYDVLTGKSFGFCRLPSSRNFSPMSGLETASAAAKLKARYPFYNRLERSHREAVFGGSGVYDLLHNPRRDICQPNAILHTGLHDLLGEDTNLSRIFQWLELYKAGKAAGDLLKCAGSVGECLSGAFGLSVDLLR